MSLVRTDVHAGVATVTLDDPERRNALTLPMVTEIIATFDELEADPAVGAVVVTGEAPAFCAGADLSHLSSSSEGGAEGGLRDDLRGVPADRPLAAAHPRGGQRRGGRRRHEPGPRSATCAWPPHRARFDTRFLQLGLHPGGGHTWMSQRIAGPQTVAATVLFGEVLDGAEAERVGLVWRCVPDDELLAAAQAMAERAASGPHELVRRTKATIADVADHRRPRRRGRPRARAAGVVARAAGLQGARRRAPGEDHEEVGGSGDPGRPAARRGARPTPRR